MIDNNDHIKKYIFLKIISPGHRAWKSTQKTQIFNTQKKIVFYTKSTLHNFLSNKIERS